MVTYGGTGDRVECLVNNVDDVPVYAVRMTIRSTNFGRVRAEASCPMLQQGADCSVTYNVPGPAIRTHLVCSARGTAGGTQPALVFYQYTTMSRKQLKPNSIAIPK